MKNFILKTLFVTILISNVSVCFAQEKPQAVLVDEFGHLNCEDISARVDSFLVEILNSPGSNGYIINYDNKNIKKQGLGREKLIRGFAKMRKFDKNRLIFIREKAEEDLRTQFWIVPIGADKPVFEKVKWDLTFSKNQKPFVFYKSQLEDGICPGGDNLDIYSEYLTQNPNARANIVIYAKSETKFQKEKKEFSEELINKYKISPKRIRFFFVRDKYNYPVYEYDPDYKIYELWLLP